MNKRRRYELKMLKYKRRLRVRGIQDESVGKFYAFRSHGAPCSCTACKPPDRKYSRAKDHRQFFRLMLSQRA